MFKHSSKAWARKGRNLDYDRLVFSEHALQKMFERHISKADVVAVIDTGRIIEKYVDDQPFPSSLLLAVASGRPIHVVAAQDVSTKTIYVITAYVPDAELWDDDFTKRKPS